MTRPKVSFETPRHTPLLDRDKRLLGCIDQLDRDAELIRLDGGLHWNMFDSRVETVQSDLPWRSEPENVDQTRAAS